MTSSTVADTLPLSGRAVAGIWLRHLTSLYFPAVALAFLWTGPHPWYVAPLFMLPLVVAHHLDTLGAAERRQPVPELPAWPFDGLVYGLAALQLLVVIETARLFATQGIFSVDMVMVFLVVGGNSGFSIITAHELIHRRSQWEQRLGRLLLCTVLYEHFYTEHLRGHHVRVGTPEDPATARFGESFEAFFRRTVPAQFRSAWHLEAARLGDENMSLWDRRMLRNRILHGLAAEWGLALALFGAFGFAALVAFVLQAYSAIRLLEAVNYFEHWGLVRSRRRVRPVDSWDTHSWFTYYGLTGLSRHADHHAWPRRPFQQLRLWDEAPILPYGYVGMVDMVMGNNDEFQQVATRELARRRLGPFAVSDSATESEGPIDASTDPVRVLEAARGEEEGPETASGWRAVLGRRWSALSPAWRVGIPLGALALVSAAGVQWETGGEGWTLPGRVLLHVWILGVLAAVIRSRRWLEDRVQNETLSWGASFVLLVALGLLTHSLVG